MSAFSLREFKSASHRNGGPETKGERGFSTRGTFGERGSAVRGGVGSMCRPSLATGPAALCSARLRHGPRGSGRHARAWSWTLLEIVVAPHTSVHTARWGRCRRAGFSRAAVLRALGLRGGHTMRVTTRSRARVRHVPPAALCQLFTLGTPGHPACGRPAVGILGPFIWRNAEARRVSYAKHLLRAGVSARWPLWFLWVHSPHRHLCAP